MGISFRSSVAGWLSIFALVSCGSESGGDGGTGGGSGTAGAGGTEPALCKDACGVTLSCDLSADTGACEAQCVKEITGAGYLNTQIALEYFQLFVDIGTDTNCNYSKGAFAWTYWTKDAAKIDALPDQSVMQECRDSFLACYGPTGTVDGYRETCFMGYYRYNTSLRAVVAACLAQECKPGNIWDCVTANQPTGEPWLAGVQQAF